MTDGHLVEDDMIALALGEVSGPEQVTSLRHLNSCPTCRAAYDDLAQAVDAVLPAAPAVAPPAGFDARVLNRLELRPPDRRRSYRTALFVAAAAAIGICGGAIGSAALLDHHETTTVSVRGASLATGDGATVGTVEPSWAHGHRVVVLQITKGHPGDHYTCRVRLKDGTVSDTGDWRVPESGQATWIVDGSSATIDRIELVADNGHIWSTAKLS